MYASGCAGASSSGSRFAQLGVSSASESQRSLRHRSPTTAALEHDVVVAGFREQAAEGEPGLAARR